MSTDMRGGSDISKKHAKETGWSHRVVVFLVFGTAGILMVAFSRFFLNGVLHLHGTILSGSWSYRLTYLLIVPPLYSVTLIIVGSLLGKHSYFKRRVVNTWGWLLGGIFKRYG